MNRRLVGEGEVGHVRERGGGVVVLELECGYSIGTHAYTCTTYSV